MENDNKKYKPDFAEHPHQKLADKVVEKFALTHPVVVSAKTDDVFDNEPLAEGQERYEFKKIDPETEHMIFGHPSIKESDKKLREVIENWKACGAVGCGIEEPEPQDPQPIIKKLLLVYGADEEKQSRFNTLNLPEYVKIIFLDGDPFTIKVELVEL